MSTETAEYRPYKRSERCTDTAEITVFADSTKHQRNQRPAQYTRLYDDAI